MKKIAIVLLTLAGFTLSMPVLSVLAAGPGQCGGASWYALSSRTASGEMMNPDAMTAAHRSLPFGTKLRVVNTANGRAVTLTINDRGPFIKRRIIDVSRAAAIVLGFKRAGHTRVCIERI